MMEFSVIFVAIALFASASPAWAATVTGFAGADCSGSGESFGVGSDECFTLGCMSVKSFGYSGVPSQIQFYLSGGAHDSCTNGADLILGGGSGCGTAPDGFNFESVAVF
ncbi:hypothetical protein HYPSUDRAFT_44650 [Hypholoma sublateritium FD-334 SS-4]|uniref:Uncharacterized protein n=1 Tax=Hypholoma sublateritium (strain FD-334 SS-4) TaxID=945553 RepID=A0A0D2M6W3_HYPSF|nr:hypothetical protein HYPSUDRAFT_44650 [Hypholoma sublateritium FD-334 SS-4]